MLAESLENIGGENIIDHSGSTKRGRFQSTNTKEGMKVVSKRHVENDQVAQ